MEGLNALHRARAQSRLHARRMYGNSGGESFISQRSNQILCESAVGVLEHLQKNCDADHFENYAGVTLDKLLSGNECVRNQGLKELFRDEVVKTHLAYSQERAAGEELPVSRPAPKLGLHFLVCDDEAIGGEGVITFEHDNRPQLYWSYDAA